MELHREESAVLQILHCGSLQSLESKIGTALGDEKGRGGTFECGAMSAHRLTFKFGIHGGGINLIFPHHENEIAHQSCAGRKGILRLLPQDLSSSIPYRKHTIGCPNSLVYVVMNNVYSSSVAFRFGSWSKFQTLVVFEQLKTKWKTLPSVGCGTLKQQSGGCLNSMCPW
ncbi:hypothetical protein ACLB2K_011091 [Fragaria x ananassa]